jgi:hypothetical protein
LSVPAWDGAIPAAWHWKSLIFLLLINRLQSLPRVSLKNARKVAVGKQILG